MTFQVLHVEPSFGDCILINCQIYIKNQDNVYHTEYL